LSVRCAVLGKPIAHSLSPAMHRAAYAHLGLDWRYDAVEVDSPGLPDFLDGLDASWRGLSLTMPLKRTVVLLVQSLDSWAQVSGVANTVLLETGQRRACNTDVPGAQGALTERVSDTLRTAAVVGGGATATSVLLALGELGCTTADLLVREPSRAGETLRAVRSHPGAPEVSVRTITEAGKLDVDVVVSTVPVSAQTPELLASCAPAPVVFEVVYDPWPTPLARAAQESGRTLVSGLDLLAHQAVLQLALMTGELVPVDVVRDAGRAELERRAGRNAPDRG
jgi:shikimate dehydrogenase